MKRLFWHDSETTGTAVTDHQMLSHAVICTNEKLEILGILETKARLMPHIVPHPTALATNNIDPYSKDWIEKSVPYKSMAQTIMAFFKEFKGDENYLIAYNAAFDKRFLSSCFDQAGLGLNSCDIKAHKDPFMMAKAAAKAGLLDTPLKTANSKFGSGTYQYNSTKLVDVSQSLGTQHPGDAHEALNDVYTMLKTTPVLWEMLSGGKPFEQSLDNPKWSLEDK